MFWGLYGYVLSNLKSFIWCGQGENIETIYSVFKPCDKKCCSKLKVFCTHWNTCQLFKKGEQQFCRDACFDNEL